MIRIMIIIVNENCKNRLDAVHHLIKTNVIVETYLVIYLIHDGVTTTVLICWSQESNPAAPSKLRAISSEKVGR